MKNIPIIDITPARLGTDKDKYDVAMKIDAACKDAGFLVIVGHGIDKKIFEQAYAAHTHFFDLPLSEKVKCKLASGFTLAADDYTPYGYSGLLEENAFAYTGEPNKPSDYVEKFSVGRLLFENKVENLPILANKHVQEIRKQIEPYYNACQQLALTLTELFTFALDLPRDFFATRINKSNDSMRLQLYPGFTSEFANDQGMGAHYDGTLITILTNTAPGIEVLNKEGQWIRPVLDDIDHFLVNIGDLMMRWSNDQYVSTKHRVVLSKQKRQSIIFFKLANDDTVIEPFPKFCKDKPAKYKPIVYKQFSLDKMNSLFGRK
jgi:isopenicillin N synthase-like dioxygenase